jgi:hypothetical protein
MRQEIELGLADSDANRTTPVEDVTKVLVSQLRRRLRLPQQGLDLRNARPAIGAGLEALTRLSKSLFYRWFANIT